MCTASTYPFTEIIADAKAEESIMYENGREITESLLLQVYVNLQERGIVDTSGYPRVLLGIREVPPCRY